MFGFILFHLFSFMFATQDAQIAVAGQLVKEPAGLQFLLVGRLRIKTCTKESTWILVYGTTVCPPPPTHLTLSSFYKIKQKKY